MSVTTAHPILEAALSYLRAGLSVIPIARDGSKAPDGRLLPREMDPGTGRAVSSWSPFTGRLPTEAEALRWWGRKDPPGIAVVGGAVSGGLECLDFDGRADELYPAWLALVEAEAPGLAARLCVVKTPGGYHVRYRCAETPIPGSTKLAIDPAVKGKGRGLIETRGEKGYALAPGCPAECHPTGRLYAHLAGPELTALETLTAAERIVLIRCARSFTLEVRPAPTSPGRPGDDYNRRGPDWADILGPHGWRLARGGPGGERYWARPGKDGPGWSATTGRCRTDASGDLLRVFSANAAPFEDGKAYSKFAAVALLEHGGDFRAAALALAGKGFGAPGKRPAPPPPEPGHGDAWEGPEVANGQAANGRAAPTPPEKVKIAFPPPIPASRLQRSEGANWLWHGYLAPGSITLMSALWKSGKTTLLAHLLRAFETGGDFCGLRVAPGRVLYVTEESEHRWAVRRDALGLRDHLSFVVRPFRGRPSWSDWGDFIAYLETVCRTNPADLLVFDPLVNLWPVRDENDNAQVGSALLPLQTLTSKGRGMLLIHHPRKGDGQEATASRGAGALTAFVDTIMEMRRYCPADRKDRRRVLTSYGRDDETPEELVVELTEGGVYVAHGDKRDAARDELRPILESLLPTEGPGLTIDQIIERWPGETAPRKQRLVDALRAAMEAESVLRNGTGKSGRPYLYLRSQKCLFPVPPLYRDGTETDISEHVETPFDSPRPYRPTEADDA